MNGKFSINAELPTKTVWVNQDVFYNLKEMNLPLMKCKLIGITCNKGLVPTFQILTPDGYLFSEVPPHFIFTKDVNPKENLLDLKDLVYNNCLSNDFAISSFPELKSQSSLVYFKNQLKYINAEYWFSLDFYNDNNWFHCMLLDNGQIAFIPSHKIIFKSCLDVKQHEFPKYEKLRTFFQV